MISVSTAFRNQLNAGNHNYVINIVITFAGGTSITLTNENLSNCTMEDAVSSDDKFDLIGATVINQLTLDILNTEEEYSEYEFVGANVVYQVGLEIEGSTQFIQKGVFIVDKATRQKSTIQLICLDYMSKFDVDYSKSQITYPATIKGIIDDACSVCGVTVSTYPEYNTETIYITPNLSSTFRSVLGYIAQITGRYAKIDRLGKLCFSGLNPYLITYRLQSPYADGTQHDEAGVTFIADYTDKLVRFQVNDSSHGDATYAFYNNSNVRFTLGQGSYRVSAYPYNMIDDQPVPGIIFKVYDVAYNLLGSGEAQSGAYFQLTAASAGVIIQLIVPAGVGPLGQWVVVEPRVYKIDNIAINDVFSIEPDKQDISITGARVYINTNEEVIDAEDNPTGETEVVKKEYLWGTEDFCVDLSGNPFIVDSNAQDIVDRVGGAFADINFRPLTSTHASDPTIEAGDFVVMPYAIKDGVTQYCLTLITRTVFKVGDKQTTICGSETAAENQAARYSEAEIAAQQAINQYDTHLDQYTIFNKLTNDGTAQGIFMEDGQLYINMSFARTGILQVGGSNNELGRVEVLDRENTVVGYLDKEGLTAEAVHLTGVIGNNSYIDMPLDFKERKYVIALAGTGNNLLRNSKSPYETSSLSQLGYQLVSSGDGYSGTGYYDEENPAPVEGIDTGLIIYDNTSGNKDFKQRITDFDDKGTSGQWVFSAYVRNAGDSGTVTALIRVYGTARYFISTVANIGTTWQRIVIPVTLSGTPTGDLSMQFGITGAGSIEYAAMQLEVGTTATDWSMNPLDKYWKREADEQYTGQMLYNENGLYVKYPEQIVDPMAGHSAPGEMFIGWNYESKNIAVPTWGAEDESREVGEEHYVITRDYYFIYLQKDTEQTVEIGGQSIDLKDMVIIDPTQGFHSNTVSVYEPEGTPESVSWGWFNLNGLAFSSYAGNVYSDSSNEVSMTLDFTTGELEVFDDIESESTRFKLVYTVYNHYPTRLYLDHSAYIERPSNPHLYFKVSDWDSAAGVNVPSGNSIIFSGINVYDSVDYSTFYSGVVLDTNDNLYYRHVLKRYDENGNEVVNGFYININADGTKLITFAGGNTTRDAWANALNVVKKAGDTMTGRLIVNRAANNVGIALRTTDIIYNVAPSTTKYAGYIFEDKNGQNLGHLELSQYTDKSLGINMGINQYINSTWTWKSLFFGRVYQNGTVSYSFSDPAAARRALGLDYVYAANSNGYNTSGTGTTEVALFTTGSYSMPAGTWFVGFSLNLTCNKYTATATMYNGTTKLCELNTNSATMEAASGGTYSGNNNMSVFTVVTLSSALNGAISIKCKGQDSTVTWKTMNYNRLSWFAIKLK